MTRVIRKYQKWLLAGGGVLLMISFVAGYGGTGGTGRAAPVEREVGRANGKAVTNTEVANAHAELSAVAQYARRFDPRMTQGVPASLLDVLFKRDVARNLVQQPELFVLLRREAVAGGIVANPAQAQQIMDDCLGGTGADGMTPVDAPSPDSDAYKATQDGVADVMLVANYYARVTAALKPSRPAVDRALAGQDQTIQLNLVPVPADPAKAARPTPQQLDQQFKTYADVAPGRPEAGNPFGFGYRVPLRTRLQYVRLTKAAVEQSVVATKADYDWEVDARKLYHAHPEQFAVSPPTTRPTDVPGPAVTPPFEKVRDPVLHAIRDPLVQAKQDQVQQFLTSTLARDFAAYQAAVTAGKPVPVTPLGQPYDARAYLLALTDAADAQFHVKVNSDQTDDLSAKQLLDLPGLSTAYAAVATSSAAASSDGSLPGYVSDRGLAYLAAAGDPKPPAALAELLRPSPVFTESAGDAVDVVRLAGVKPAVAAASLDAVRPAVEADVRTAAAYDAAKAQADRLVAAAPAGKLQDLAAAAHLTPIATQPLSMRDVTVDKVDPPLEDAAPDFMAQAFALLNRYDPAKDPHPATVIAVPSQHRLFVAQLSFVAARWTAADYAAARLSAAAQLQQAAASAARVGWFGTDAIVQRTGFKPAAAPAGS